MILAGASGLPYMGEDQAPVVSRASYEGAREAIAEGVRTADLGGGAAMDEFTDEVIKRVRTKLDVWAALGDSTLRY
jgi:isocitrate/isopropylmalate dehydrogenase